MDRSQRIQIAEETQAILKKRTYVTNDDADSTLDLSEALDNACQGTLFHRSDDPLTIPPILTPCETKLYMTRETTLQCLQRLTQEKSTKSTKSLILNFASAKTPGGGLNRGSWEQEEHLAAASGLLACLTTPQAKPFYDRHQQMTKPSKESKKTGVLLYTSNMIYSPDVPVFRNPDMELKAEPLTCNIISASCVNWNAGMLSKKVDKEEEESALRLMQTRVLRVLQVAVHHGADRLILGPWGCGINKNSPREVAKALNGALLHPDMEGRFREVVIAVPYDDSSNVYKYFAKAFFEKCV